LIGEGASKNSIIFVNMKGLLGFVFCVAIASVALVSCKEETKEVVKATPKTIDSLLQVYPDSVELLVIHGNIALKEYRYYDALADGAKAYRLDSNNIDARLLYAMAQNNKPDRTIADVYIAQKHFKSILVKQPQNTDVLVALATTYGFQQDFDSAFKFVNQALRIDPKKRDAYVFKGSLYLLMDNVKLAKSSYETAVQQDPTFFEGYIRLGTIYQIENNPIALEYFTTAHKLEPKNSEGTYVLAYGYQSFEKFDLAKTTYRKMVQTDTSDYYVSRGLFQIGYIKQFHENQLDSAIYYYTSAIQTDALYLEAHHNRGLCYETKGNIEEALKNYSKALRINPNYELSRNAAEKHRSLDDK